MRVKTLGLIALPVAGVAALASRVTDADMGDSVSVRMNAPVDDVWALLTDVTNTSRYSEETFDAEWLDGATEAAVGARFRGRVKRNGRGPAYWTECRIDTCDHNRDFQFTVVAGNRAVNTWRYQFAPVEGSAVDGSTDDGGTEVTESFQLAPSPFTRAYWAVAGPRRRPTNLRNMRTTLENVKRIVEA